MNKFGKWWTLTGEKVSKAGFSWLFIHLLALNFKFCMVNWQVNVNDDHKAAFGKRNINNIKEEEEDLPMFGKQAGEGGCKEQSCNKLARELCHLILEGLHIYKYMQWAGKFLRYKTREKSWRHQSAHPFHNCQQSSLLLQHAALGWLYEARNNWAFLAENLKNKDNIWPLTAFKTLHWVNQKKGRRYQ